MIRQIAPFLDLSCTVLRVSAAANVELTYRPQRPSQIPESHHDLLRGLVTELDRQQRSEFAQTAGRNTRLMQRLHLTCKRGLDMH